MDSFLKQGGGIFLDAEEKEKISQPFVKLHGQYAFAVTGIGLAICERIVARHHGEMKVFNSGESGNTFKVVFPMKQGSE
jgi:signal transduction histidine kinase